MLLKIIATIIVIRDEPSNFDQSSKSDNKIVFGTGFFLTFVLKLVPSLVYAEYGLSFYTIGV